MKKIQVQNAIVKRKFYDYKKATKGFSESTMTAMIRAISSWENFTNGEDFRNFNPAKVKEFVTYLLTKKKPPLSLNSCNHTLLYLRTFYEWLPLLDGYKRKIKLTDAEYFRLDRKMTKIAQFTNERPQPTQEMIIKAVNFIKINNELDRRDQALMAFAYLSGMRIKALITLPLRCVDVESLRINQDPGKGVDTKFTKKIPTTLFIFDEELVEIFRQWVQFLREEKLFGDDEPLFPASLLEQKDGNSFIYSATKLSRQFWRNTGSARDIFKKRFKEAGLNYFSPHSFRHAAIDKALSLAETDEQRKAISQNVGHERLATTYEYAPMRPEQVADQIKNLTKPKEQKDREKMLDTLAELVKDKMEKAK
jgi:integrase